MRNALILMNKNALLMQLSECLSQNGFATALCHSIGNAEKQLLTSYFDVVIFDFALGDGVQSIIQICVQMKIGSICVAENVNDSILNFCRQHGTEFVIDKSMPIATMVNRILFYSSANVRRFDVTAARDDRNKKIVRMLDSVGMRHNRLGFKYAEQALREMLRCNNSLPICKIYQNIAQKEQTKANCVERCIRSAIEEAWTNNSINAAYDFFGYSVKEDKGKPTNKEFLWAIYEKLRLNV